MTHDPRGISFDASSPYWNYLEGILASEIKFSIFCLRGLLLIAEASIAPSVTICWVLLQGERCRSCRGGVSFSKTSCCLVASSSSITLDICTSHRRFFKMHKRATLHGSSISQATSHDGAYTQTLAGSAERTASTRTEVVVDPKITTRHLAAIAPYRQHAGQSAAAAQGVRTGRTIPRGFDFDQGTYTHAPSRRSQQSGVPVWDDDVERRSRGRATMGRRIPLREWLSSLSFPGSAHDPRMRRHVSTRTALALFVSIVLWMAWLAWPSIAIGARSSATSRKGGFPKRVAGRSGSKSQAVLSETHVEDNDGMLRLNVTSRIHPIYQLMQNAAREWESKVSRQSKSLHEAVVEYRRRYGRPPPEGFDKWWHYVR